MKSLRVLCAATSILAFSACTPKHVDMPLSDRQMQTTGSEQTQKQTLQQDGTEKKRGSGIVEENLLGRTGEERTKAAAKGDGNVTKQALPQDIYFDFDSYALRSETLPVLKEVARSVNQNQSTRLVVEGHCDERGTTEYNMVLGQKRADAAKDHLAALGVSEKKMKAISYGKEAPADPGHTEESWARNRRVHFAIQ